MNLRKILFWTHLTMGVVAGVFVLLLSVTGVLLTYEHAIVDHFAASEAVAAPTAGQARSVDDMARIARQRSQGAMLIMLNFVNRDKAPVVVHPIGGAALPEWKLNPYTGDSFAGASDGVAEFFETVVGLHRWLAFEGSGRGLGRSITGAVNLAFFFMVLTGIYLWLPKAWKWVFLRPKILFRGNLPTSKARNFSWHHVFSFWALLPLLVVVGTAVVISYPWANGLLHRAFGAEAPKQGGPAFIGDLRKDAAISVAGLDTSQFAPLQAALDAAKQSHPNWQKIHFFVHPKADVPVVRVMVNNSKSVLPENITTLTFDRRENRVTKVHTFGEQSAAERARMWVRFAHTGEQYGLVGSTLAGLASVATAFLVYTGLALAYRRWRDYVARKQRRELAG